MISPTLSLERSLLRAGHRIVAGMDEVGRGALAGPVCVGVVALDRAVRIPAGLRDSKLLTPHARSALVAPLTSWGAGHGLGWASAAEIDEVGITLALRRAGLRALAALAVTPDVVILDGSYDWLGRETLADAALGADGGAVDPPPFGGLVAVRPKADRDCATVAAASVLAKCARDARMAHLSAQHPDYGWERNKGYGTADHLAALRQVGPCELHRRSWRLPQVAADFPHVEA